MLEGETPISWNKLYSGVHWSKRREVAQAAHRVVRAVLDPELPPFDKPVDIIFTAYFADHPLDASNICTKIYEDALKGWYIADDNPAFVHSVVAQSRIDKERPRLEIEIREVEQPDLVGCHVSCQKCGKKFSNIGALLEHVNNAECSNGVYEEV